MIGHNVNIYIINEINSKLEQLIDVAYFDINYDERAQKAGNIINELFIIKDKLEQSDITLESFIEYLEDKSNFNQYSSGVKRIKLMKEILSKQNDAIRAFAGNRFCPSCLKLENK